jgi:hypothetical protein
MATYKVLQDIEAEDKLIGPLTLRQCIYAGIAMGCSYLSVLATSKHAAFVLVLFVPVIGICSFFAFPWRQDQPTEVWALAKIRFYLKPRRRIWDQSDVKQLVTITAPKHVERVLTNGLNQDEVRSRLNALASTIDSRGWAIKNVNVSLGNSLTLPGRDSRRSRHCGHRQCDRQCSGSRRPSAAAGGFLVYAPPGYRAGPGNVQRRASGSPGHVSSSRTQRTASGHAHCRRAGAGGQIQGRK